VVDSQQQQQHYAGAEYTSSSVLLQRTGDLALPIDYFDSTLSVVYHFLLQATCPCLMCTRLHDSIILVNCHYTYVIIETSNYI